MPRPIRCRRVAFIPGVYYFKPAGIPLRILEEVLISIEEAEAIRLKDIEDLDQEHSAEKMNISRPTFQRVLESARKKIADALINGKAIRIEGGNFEMAAQRLRCAQGHEWSIQSSDSHENIPSVCPECNSQSVITVPAGRDDWQRRRQGGRGR